MYLPPFYQAERSLASALLRLQAARGDRLAGFASVDWDKALGWLRGRTGASLAPEQADAVRLALTSRVAVLTGGPGCGKSFTVRSVVELARAKGARIVLAAPTGRAAKRLAELTGHEAATIHRLLQLRPGGEPSFDASSPLDADLVVVDETSMVDVILANKLVKAVAPGAHLLLVGDVDQLPSVGAGEVLRDLLAAGSLPVVRLTRIFRQAQQSGIVVNAHRINDGRHPLLSGFGDFFLFSCEDGEQTAGLVVDIVARRIPSKFGLDPRRDVQVLCPMHRGPAGAGNLNLLLQEALTPFADGRPERRYGGRVFRVGDKVTQLRNNYDKGAAGIFNGTVGVVTGLSAEEHTLTVLTDEDESVDYGFDELDELAHAYAVTIHRSQGSEYPAVVIPLTTASWMMLQRNLLYTGVTRAKKLVVLGLAPRPGRRRPDRGRRRAPHRPGAPAATRRLGRCPELGADPGSPCFCISVCAGLVNRVIAGDPAGYRAQVAALAEQLARSPDYPARLAAKARELAAAEKERPLAAYRAAELAIMSRNFSGPGEPYAQLRQAFVYKEKPPRTPPHLARHRSRPLPIAARQCCAASFAAVGSAAGDLTSCQRISALLTSSAGT